MIAAVGAADGLLRCIGYDGGKAAFAVLLMLAIYSSPPLAAFFSGAPVARARADLFPLYLIQFPVLLSLTSGLIVAAGAAGPPTLVAIWGVSLASVAACLLAAIAFAPVETVARGAGDAHHRPRQPHAARPNERRRAGEALAVSRAARADCLGGGRVGRQRFVNHERAGRA